MGVVVTLPLLATLKEAVGQLSQVILKLFSSVVFSAMQKLMDDTEKSKQKNGTKKWILFLEALTENGLRLLEKLNNAFILDISL